MVCGDIVKPNFEWDPEKAETKNEEKFYQEAG
jgi:hypothetical protein